MCGITGYIDLKNPIEASIIQLMTDTLAHRGPDGEGIYINEEQTVALGHRRLSFLDLSEAGKQPMLSIDEEVVISFNGEIYNFLELKDQLSNYNFKSSTDTEVLIAAYQKWGMDMVNKLEGMFAFALYDRAINKIFLVRDNFGIKPLYYTIQNERLLFASELKAIIHSNVVQREIDFSSFADYFVYRYIPSPKTIWKNIYKLPPAHFAEINCLDLSIKLTEYWTIKSDTLKQKDASEVVGEFLKQSVEKQSFADVSIGSFLSGGYDSSALVLWMKELKKNPQTFSIGFSSWEKSEDHYASIVAKHLNVPNQSIVADDESLNLVDKMYQVYDEPIADISIVPTYLVSNLACQKVKAVVSGEGADELFGGYTWQHDFYQINYPDSTFGKLKEKIFKTDTVDYYANAMAMGGFDRNELKKMLNPALHQYISNDVHWFYRKHYRKELSPIKSIQYLDMKCFMGELVLTKVDRASMANSLEVRVPFLNKELFQYVFSLDEQTYFIPDQTKYLLYQQLETELPTTILQRKKQGFVGPDSYYMNIEWYKKQFKNSKLVELNIINRDYIDNLLCETYNWKLWKLLIMEKWFAKWAANF